MRRRWKLSLEEGVKKARNRLGMEKVSCKEVTTVMQTGPSRRKEKVEESTRSGCHQGKLEASDEVMPLFPATYKDESRLRKQVNGAPEYGKIGPTFYFQGETRIGEPAQKDIDIWTCLEACYPKILKLPANGQYGIMEPTFEGKTVDIMGAPPLAEILEVGITATARGRMEIRGTIKVLFKESDLLFFERLDDDHPQIVHDKGLLELTRPRVGLIGCTYLKIIATINVRTDERVEETVDITVKWKEYLNESDKIVTEYDKVKQVTEYGSRGESVLQLSYVVYENSVLACIEITFEPLCPVEIGGRIKAHNNRFPDWESFLFCKERSPGECFRVEDGEQQLPLLRSVATVPVFSRPREELWKEHVVCDQYDEAELHDGCLQIYFNLTNIRDQGTIALGSLKFLTKKYGDCVSRIYSQYGVMQVKVSFMSFWGLNDLLCTYQGRREL